MCVCAVYVRACVFVCEIQNKTMFDIITVLLY